MLKFVKASPTSYAASEMIRMMAEFSECVGDTANREDHEPLRGHYGSAAVGLIPTYILGLKSTKGKS